MLVLYVGAVCSVYNSSRACSYVVVAVSPSQCGRAFCGQLGSENSASGKLAEGAMVESQVQNHEATVLFTRRGGRGAEGQKKRVR